MYGVPFLRQLERKTVKNLPIARLAAALADAAPFPFALAAKHRRASNTPPVRPFPTRATALPVLEFGRHMYPRLPAVAANSLTRKRTRKRTRKKKQRHQIYNNHWGCPSSKLVGYDTHPTSNQPEVCYTFVRERTRGVSEHWVFRRRCSRSHPEPYSSTPSSPKLLGMQSTA